jgi:hypothetical protein
MLTSRVVNTSYLATARILAFMGGRKRNASSKTLAEDLVVEAATTVAAASTGKGTMDCCALKHQVIV